MQALNEQQLQEIYGGIIGGCIPPILEPLSPF